MGWASAIQFHRLQQENTKLKQQISTKMLTVNDFRCYHCGTTENLDMPGLCRKVECQEKARKC